MVIEVISVGTRGEGGLSTHAIHLVVEKGSFDLDACVCTVVNPV